MDEKIQCNFCSREFSQKGNLQTHMNNVHGDMERKYSCLECGKSFKYSYALKKHLQTHFGPDFVCTLCDFKTKDKIWLMEHNNAIHLKI